MSSEQDLARRSAGAMLGADRASRAAGVRLRDVAPGRAVVSMPVREDMANGHGTCHGGWVFLLADTAFAVACNTAGVTTVAAGADITFLAPARPGEELVATAEERATSGRSGVYDVTVRRGSTTGDVVAEFRGRSRALPHQPFPPPVPDQQPEEPT